MTTATGMIIIHKEEALVLNTHTPVVGMIMMASLFLDSKAVDPFMLIVILGHLSLAYLSFLATAMFLHGGHYPIIMGITATHRMYTTIALFLPVHANIEKSITHINPIDPIAQITIRMEAIITIIIPPPCITALQEIITT